MAGVCSRAAQKQPPRLAAWRGGANRATGPRSRLTRRNLQANLAAGHSLAVGAATWGTTPERLRARPLTKEGHAQARTGADAGAKEALSQNGLSQHETAMQGAVLGTNKCKVASAGQSNLEICLRRSAAQTLPTATRLLWGTSSRTRAGV